MLSRKIQKKQKRPRSKTIPSARPISSENDARPPVSVLELKRYAQNKSPRTMTPATLVRIVSALLQEKLLAAPVTEPLVVVTFFGVTQCPKQFLLD
jgi:hypothetical protein